MIIWWIYVEEYIYHDESRRLSWIFHVREAFISQGIKGESVLPACYSYMILLKIMDARTYEGENF